jgi:hypothetical protein
MMQAYILMFHLFFFCTFVTIISDACLSSVFFCMLQVLYLDVSKVNRDVAHVTLVFQLYVPNISSIDHIAKISFGYCNNKSSV